MVTGLWRLILRFRGNVFLGTSGIEHNAAKYQDPKGNDVQRSLRCKAMKKSTGSARGTAMKGQLALVKARALMEANLVGPFLIDNPNFLKTLGCTPETIATVKRCRHVRGRFLH